MARDKQNRQQQGSYYSTSNIQPNVQPGIPANPDYRMDITVTNRTRPNIIGTTIEIVAGIAVLAIIVVVLLTGIGAIMVNMNTTGGLPQPVVDWSMGFYHSFFG